MAVIPRGHKTGPIFCIKINFRAIPVEETGIKGMAQKIADVCRSCYESNQGPEFFARLDKKEILEKVEYQVINAEKNRTRLMEMPHERLLDLATIYRMVLSEDEECKIHFAVTYSFCKMYEISGEELAAAAKQNMESREFYSREGNEPRSSWLDFGDCPRGQQLCCRAVGVLTYRQQKSICQRLRGCQKRRSRFLFLCISSTIIMGTTGRTLCFATVCLKPCPGKWKMICISCLPVLMKSS